MGKKRNERGAASREMELAPTREHRTNSQSHSGKLPYVTVRDSQQRVTSKEAPLDCRGTQMLSPKCASRRSAVSKIIRTQSVFQSPTKHSPGLEAINEHGNTLHLCFQPVLCKPPSSEVETGADRETGA